MAASSSAIGARRDVEVISLVGFAHGTSHFFHLVLPSLFPWLMTGFGMSFTEAGSLMTVFFVISGVGQALAGFIVDRIGARRVLVAGVSLLALSAIALRVAQSYAMLALAAAIAGLGNCVFHPADFTILNRRVSPPQLGHAFSVHGLAAYLGWAAAPPVVTGIAAVAGWRVAALAAAAVGGVALIALLWQRKVLDDVAEPSSHMQPHAVKASSLAFLRSRAVWLCFAFFLAITLAFGALQNFGPVTLDRIYGISLPLATTGLTAYLLGGAAGTAGGGYLAKRNEQDKVIALALIGAALVALVLASGAVPAWSVVALMGLMGFGNGIAGPSRDLLVRKAATASFGTAAFGRVYGFVYSGLDVGLAAAPLLFGLLMDAGRFQQVLLGVAVLQALAVVTALRVGMHSRLAPSHA